VYISKEKFELGRNFGTKIWNAARFMQMQQKGETVEAGEVAFRPELLTADDQYILAKLHATIRECDSHLEKYRFNDYAKAVYEFVWHEFCDWYVEYAKRPLNGGDADRKAETLKVMNHVLCGALRLLHPVMPFLTEELWHGMGYSSMSESIMLAPWPKAKDEEELAAEGISAEAVAYVAAKHAAIGLGRNLRADYGLGPQQNVDFVLRPADAATGERVAEDAADYATALKAGKVEVREGFEPTGAMPSVITPLGTLFLSLGGNVDAEAEKKRLGEQLAKCRAELESTTKRLENSNFVTRAPEAVVEQVRVRKKELQEKAEKLAGLLAALG
jgi:valyl-tRNA synthetase